MMTRHDRLEIDVSQTPRRWAIQVKFSANLLDLPPCDRPAIAAPAYTVISLKARIKRPSRAIVSPAPARSRQPSLAPITRIETGLCGQTKLNPSLGGPVVCVVEEFASFVQAVLTMSTPGRLDYFKNDRARLKATPSWATQVTLILHQ